MNTPNVGLETIPTNSLQPSVPVNNSFQTIDALMSLVVVSMSVNTPPTTATSDIGKRWIIGTTPTGEWTGRARQVALCTAAGLWRYYVPWNGLVAYNLADSAEYRWSGSAWVTTGGGGGGGIPDAPSDGQQYGREDGAWTPVAVGVTEAPEDGTPYVRQDGEWEPATAGGGIPDAPSDGQQYGRENGAWTPIESSGGGGIPDAPSDGSTYGRKDGAWTAVPGAVTNQIDLITQASAFTAVPATHAGRHRLILASGNVTFNTTGIAAGQCYNIRSTGAVTLVGSGVTLTPTDGGTLAMTANMQVTVVMTSGTTGIVMGLTVAP